MGERSIAPMGHVSMMAAIQPFISGALSKTVNLPDEATVEDVENIYFQGWKLGLKALAIYRDNCKVGQPLQDKKDSEKGAEVADRRGVPADPQAAAEEAAVADRVVLGRRRRGLHDRGRYPDDGLGEVFLKMSKQGSTLAGVMDAFSVAISIGLQYGVPLETFVAKFTNMRFEPAGMTDDPDVRIAQSVMDYIFRRLALDYLPYETRAELGIFTAEERAATVAGPVRRRACGRGRGRRRGPGAVGAGVGPEGPGRHARPGAGAQLHRAAGAAAGHRRRRAAVHDLRHQDAPGRQLLRLRGLREHQRLQLMSLLLT